MDIGKRIKQLREAKGWTTNHLANRCGISQSRLSLTCPAKREGQTTTFCGRSNN